MKKSNRKILWLALSVGLILLIGLPIVLSDNGPFKEYMLYRKAKGGSAFYSKEYIRLYPDGKYTEKVISARNMREFNTAKKNATVSSGYDKYDQCKDIFVFIKERKDAVEYNEALQIAEEYGYKNYKALKDWGKIFMYLEMFPAGGYSNEFREMKKETVENAIAGIDEKVKSGKMSFEQSELAKNFINQILRCDQQPKIAVSIEPGVKIEDPYGYKSDFKASYLEKSFRTNLEYNIERYFPGKNFVVFDSLEDEKSIVIKLTYKVENMDSYSDQLLTGQYYTEHYSYTTVNESKRVSQWNPIKKRYEEKTVNQTRSVPDYSKPPTYTPAGFFYFLKFSFDCRVDFPEGNVGYQFNHVYHSTALKSKREMQINTVYEEMSDAAVLELLEKILPRI